MNATKTRTWIVRRVERREVILHDDPDNRVIQPQTLYHEIDRVSAPNRSEATAEAARRFPGMDLDIARAN